MAPDNSPSSSADALQIPLEDIVEISRIITETASDAIITINEDSTILFINRAAVNIFGYPVEELVGADHRLCILIVEDQPDTLEMLAAHFKVRGYETLSCNSAAEALRIADREHFDILISDIAMPAMDGLQLIRSLRQKKGLEETPAIALTGYVSQKDAEAAIAAGFNMHLAKPVEPSELSAAVEKLLDSCRNRDR